MKQEFLNVIVVNKLTQLRDGVAFSSTKIYLEAVGFHTLNGIQVAWKTVR
jgi:hypothetical protein